MTAQGGIADASRTRESPLPNRSKNQSTALRRPAIVAVDGLSVVYRPHGRPPFKAVTDVSFELGAQEILGVLGESGAGKSTVGKVVAGFIPPTEGQLRVADTSGELQPRRIRPGHGFRDIQMIFQESATALDPRLHVWRAVSEGITARRKADRNELAVQFLGRVGLSPAYARRRPSELSGGERQRVAIARALAAEPAVIVCDEAVSSLDVSIRAVLLNILSDLRDEQGISLLFISHDISVISHLADRILVMYKGDIVESGPTPQVIESPSHPYTRQLISAVPTLER